MQLKLISWEDEYKKDIASGIGFHISNPQGITKDRKKTIDGIYSQLFGGEEIEQLSELYSCECKATKGKFYEGCICSECGTEVKYHNNDIEKTGWICINDYYIIMPLYYNILVKVIGNKNLNNIIKYNKEIDRDGNVVVNMEDYDENNPFMSIGMIEFKERFEEVMQYYHKGLKPEKEKYYKMLMDNKDKVFSSKIPVFSLILRPINIIKDNVVYTDINKKYALFLANVSSLNKNQTIVDRKMIKILPLLYETQLILNEIHSMTINMISGKQGFIRNQILGMRINYSSRCVIVPLIGKYKINDVVLPYLCFLELYKFEIINLLSKMDKITPIEANNRWREAQTHFDKRIYLIMKYILKNTKGGVKVLINRNPSISYGSILSMNVADIKSDYSDLTMSIPINVLQFLAGDFDGDVLNIISIKDAKMAESYDKVFNPAYMMIDKNNGTFNRAARLIKDQAIGLHAFCSDEEDDEE